MWGYIKSLVYADPLPIDEQAAAFELVARIHAAFALITPEMIRKATQDVIPRARMCLASGGQHFQQKK